MTDWDAFSEGLGLIVATFAAGLVVGGLIGAGLGWLMWRH